MKTYKHKNGWKATVNDGVGYMEHETLQGHYPVSIQDLIDFGFEEIKKPLTAYNGMYFGDEDDVEHYFIDASLDIACSDIQATKGLSFLKEKDAEKFSIKLKALKLMRKRHAENDGNFVPDWVDKKQEKYYIIWRKSSGYVINVTGSFNSQPLLPYFSSHTKAEQCIEEIGDDLLPLSKD